MTDRGIIAEDVAVAFGDTPVLRDVSCQVQPGRITGLIGPSGSGKTTFMRVVVGLQRLQRGRIVVLGKTSYDTSLRSQVGYVTQSPAVYDDLTVLQNLQYFAVLAGVSQKRISEVIQIVELAPQTRQLVGTVSGGQRARVSLAIALLGDPQVLILDEPTVGLDPILREKLWSLFAGLAAKGKTLLISSHVMDEADRCDDLLLLRDGALLWADSRQALLVSTRTKSVGEAFLKIIKEGAQ